MKPILQALVLAERIYTDVTGKKVIAGTFNSFTIGKIVLKEKTRQDGSKIPMLPGGTDPGCPSLYISLTDVVNQTEISVQYVDRSRNMAIFESSFVIENQDRLGTVEIIAPLPPPRRFLKGPGTFSFDVLWKGEILGSYRLLVFQRPDEGDGETQPDEGTES